MGRSRSISEESLLITSPVCHIPFLIWEICYEAWGGCQLLGEGISLAPWLTWVAVTGLNSNYHNNRDIVNDMVSELW